jgi:hypothetical protein
MSGSARLGTRARSTLGPSPRGEVADGPMFSSAKSRIHRAGASGLRGRRVVSGCAAWPPLRSHLAAERKGSSEPRPRSRGLFMDGLRMWAISGRLVHAPGARRDHYLGGGFFCETSAKVAKVAVKPRHRERLVLRTDISAPQSGKSKRSVTKNAHVPTSSQDHILLILYFVRFGHGVNVTSCWRQTRAGTSRWACRRSSVLRGPTTSAA